MIRKYKYLGPMKQYGRTFQCKYGTRIVLHESSCDAQNNPEVWLRLSSQLSHLAPGTSCALLTPKMARELIARLRAWLDDIGER